MNTPLVRRAHDGDRWRDALVLLEHMIDVSLVKQCLDRLVGPTVDSAEELITASGSQNC